MVQSPSALGLDATVDLLICSEQKVLGDTYFSSGEQQRFGTLLLSFSSSVLVERKETLGLVCQARGVFLPPCWGWCLVFAAAAAKDGLGH